ncbi:hypothetical protein P3L10_029940 [Capsicum annuum]|uniref:uncharacterized protein LOC107846966 n=1 Tax=Capsicum annuum TaxID=4072 RepID=UPI0007BF6FF8|nr:uncharacterized protein LOC107846966 [Capsicum annuum]
MRTAATTSHQSASLVISTIFRHQSNRCPLPIRSHAPKTAAKPPPPFSHFYGELAPTAMRNQQQRRTRSDPASPAAPMTHLSSKNDELRIHIRNEFERKKQVILAAQSASIVEGR